MTVAIAAPDSLWGGLGLGSSGSIEASRKRVRGTTEGTVFAHRAPCPGSLAPGEWAVPRCSQRDPCEPSRSAGSGRGPCPRQVFLISPPGPTPTMREIGPDAPHCRASLIRACGKWSRPAPQAHGTSLISFGRNSPPAMLQLTVQPGLLLLDPVLQELLPLVVQVQRPDVEHRLGSLTVHRIPVCSSRSLTRWRHAPSATPLPIG